MSVVAEIVVAEIIDEREYVGLLASTLPHVIHTEQENERCISALEALDSRRDLSVEEKRIAELLTLLIEDFEDKNYALPSASPVEIVRQLMDSNGLRQVDMVDVYGSASIASEVLNGKRDFAKGHIERLSHRFNVSPELFFPRPRVAVDVAKVAANRKDLEAALASVPVCWTYSSAHPRYPYCSVDNKSTTKPAFRFSFAEFAGMLVRIKTTRDYTWWELAKT